MGHQKYDKSIRKKCPRCKFVKPLRYFGKDSNNKDGIRSACKRCETKSSAKRLTSERGKALRRERDRIRTAAKLNIKENFTALDELAAKQKFNFCCFKCGISEEDHKRQFGQVLSCDHHAPISKGYSLTKSNCVILCRQCNSAKGEKWPWEFYSLDEMIDLYNLGIRFPFSEN